MRRLRKVETCEWTMFFTVFFFCCLIIAVDYQNSPMKFSLKKDLIISSIISFFIGYLPGKYIEAIPSSSPESKPDRKK